MSVTPMIKLNFNEVTNDWLKPRVQTKTRPNQKSFFATYTQKLRKEKQIFFYFLSNSFLYIPTYTFTSNFAVHSHLYLDRPRFYEKWNIKKRREWRLASNLHFEPNLVYFHVRLCLFQSVLVQCLCDC